MKKRHYIALSIVLAGLAVCLWIALHPRQLPYDQCSEVFLRYRDADGVRVAFLKDYPVDDSVRTDVTLLKAQDSVTWAGLIVALCHNGNINDFLPGKVFFKPVPKDDSRSTNQEESINEYIIVAYRPDLTVGVFHVETLAQQKSIIDKYINSLVTKNI